MATILAGLRPPPPVAVGPQWPGVTSMTWSAAGETLNLLDPMADGIMVLRDGIRGLNMPPVERFTSTSPAVPGSRWRGHRVQDRGVFWPTLVWSREGYREWQSADARLWSTLRPDVVGEWTVVTDATGPRTLRARYAGDGDHTYSVDPLRYGWTVYGIELVAEDPFWLGEPVVERWGAGGGTGRGFLPGPPFFIGSSATVDTAVMHNHGDLPTYVVWRIEGPATTAQVGFRKDERDGTVTRSVVPVPFPIGEGETLVIDTHPEMQTATLETPAGVPQDRTAGLGAGTSFRPVPAGDEVTLELALEGTGRISAEFRPHYWRAFS